MRILHSHQCLSGIMFLFSYSKHRALISASITSKTIHISKLFHCVFYNLSRMNDTQFDISLLETYSSGHIGFVKVFFVTTINDLYL